ncbi:MAG TPA: dolichyl-phosphate beta-glucosyltransferase [Pyrinomonadaceae bacterium]|jgi:glycosyltransferase involved in cell wall biosynthesis
MSFSLSLVIPAYNEEARLGKTLREVFAYLNAEQPASELIVVDDGSRDGTVRVAEEAFAAHAGRVSPQVIRLRPNAGKGYAVRTGLLAARAPVALFSDADLSTPITETPKLTGPIRAGQYDVVFGSRALDRELVGVRQPMARELSGRFFNVMVRLGTGLPFADTQCGFKAFRLDVCRPLVEACVIDRFGFDVELLYVAYAAGLRLKEWPVRWNDVAGSKVSFQTGLQGFNEIRAVRRHARRGTYAAAIEHVRDIVAHTDTRAPLYDETKGAPPSDIAPELATADRRL